MSADNGPAAPAVPASGAPPASRTPSLADPVPVGIAGFGMTTFILSCVNAGFFGGTAATPMVLGLAIFYGGLVQLVAGMWAFRRGETFVAAAFCSYGGGFWLSSFRSRQPARPLLLSPLIGALLEPSQPEAVNTIAAATPRGLT